MFNEQAAFDNAAFGGDLSFRGAVVRTTLKLVDTTLEGRADFRESRIAELDWNSDNRPTAVKGVFDARDARLKRLTIKDVHFSDLADFSGAVFGSAASETERKILFEDVIFERAADFLRADFYATATFVDNRFRGVLDLTNASFEPDAHLCLRHNRITRILMDREHLGKTQAWQIFRKWSAKPSG